MNAPAAHRENTETSGKERVMKTRMIDDVLAQRFTRIAAARPAVQRGRGFVTRVRGSDKNQFIETSDLTI